MRTRIIGLVGGLSVLAALAAPAISSGATKVGSQVSIEAEDPEWTQALQEDGQDAFAGEVTSDKKACTKKRKVKLFKDSDPVNEGVLTTATGDWKYETEDPDDGTYRVKVSKKKKGKFICKGAKSQNLVVDDYEGPADDDVDGFFTGAGGDCDGTDSSRFPGATEIMNLKDDDCDGLGDDTGATDNDGDGQAGPQDCDDTNTLVMAGATEIHDGIDNDCDGQADENFFVP